MCWFSYFTSVYFYVEQQIFYLSLFNFISYFEQPTLKMYNTTKGRDLKFID